MIYFSLEKFLYFYYMLNKLKSSYRDILAVIFIAVIGLLVLSGFKERIDINLTDDTGYLILGLRITEMPLAGFGPLYSIMYKVLKQLTPDIVSLYDLAMHLMYLIPPIVAYVMLRILKVGVVISFLISVGFMISPSIMSFITWSKISHYTIIWVMVWVILVIKKVKNVSDLLFSLVVLTFLLGYIRPESHLSWYISTVVFIGYSIWNKRNGQAALPKKKLVLAASIFTFYIGLTLLSSVKGFGLINTLINPMAGGRSNIAFAQQFSYNYCEWNGLNNFDWIQWRDYSKENFGEFNTLGEAFKNNPNVFIQHIVYNIEQYVKKFYFALQSIFFPPAVFKWSKWISAVLFLVVIAVRIVYVGGKNWRKQFLSYVQQYAWLLFSLAIIAFPSVIASVIFYTREHYLLLIMPLVLFVLGLIFLPKKSEVDRTPRIVSYLGLPLVIFICVVFHPTLKDYRTYDVWEEYTYPSNRKTIEFLQNMNISQDIREIDHEGGFHVYVAKNYKWINIIGKEEQSYEEFAAEHQPNMYYVTRALLSNRFLTQDSVFMDIIEHPDKHGFHKVELQKENKGYLLVHDTIQFHPR